MREIKFRAWDKVNKRMFMVDEIHNLWSMHDMWDNENSELKMRPHLFVIEQIFKDADTDNKLHVPDEAEIMQFTGLKDKNGKEIFESDLILINGVHKMKIVFHRGGFKAIEMASMFSMKFGDTYLHELTSIVDQLECVEVIGNEFENKEG